MFQFYNYLNSSKFYFLGDKGERGEIGPKGSEGFQGIKGKY